MKHLFIFLFFAVSLIQSSNISQLQAMQMVDLPSNNCLMKYDTHPPHYDFGNIYHSGSTGSILQEKIISSYKAICGFYVSGGREEYLTVDRIFPVYLPRGKEPIGAYTIYTGQDYTIYKYDDPTAFYTGAFYAGMFSRMNPLKGMFPKQFNGGGLFSGNERQPHNEAYLISLQEPFKSAPMLQMYSYMGQPLLVARSSTGIVTDVFFQGRPNISNPMERAKRYLGKKWFNP